MMHIDIQGSCTTGLLLQTGSHVVQLTSHGHHLLVCTLASSFTLQYITGKLSQVCVCVCLYLCVKFRCLLRCHLSPSQIGHQDRKAGPYGACFSAEADNIFVARPGLRLWKAQASTGTVTKRFFCNFNSYTVLPGHINIKIP